jgi:hypothetical protein
MQFQTAAEAIESVLGQHKGPSLTIREVANKAKTTVSAVIYYIRKNGLRP